MARKVQKKVFKTGNCGRKNCWTAEQKDLIDAALPAWHDFAFVQNSHLDGRDKRMVDYKKKEAQRLLSLPEFTVDRLREGVSV